MRSVGLALVEVSRVVVADVSVIVGCEAISVRLVGAVVSLFPVCVIVLPTVVFIVVVDNDVPVEDC